MFYEQCVGNGTMHDSVREKFDWFFSEDSGNYNSCLQADYVDDYRNTG